MKLKVEGVEEIEITDPKGLCNPVQQGIPLPALPAPATPHVNPGIPAQPWPAPQIPTPWPGKWTINVPHKPPIYTRHVLDPHDPFLRAKWGIGGPMIQQASRPGPDKWEKNWQAKMSGEEGPVDGNRNTN